MLKSIEFDLAHEFCSEIHKLDKRTNGNALLHLEQMLQDYSPKTTINAVLQSLSDRMRDVEEEDD